MDQPLSIPTRTVINKLQLCLCGKATVYISLSEHSQHKDYTDPLRQPSYNDEENTTAQSVPVKITYKSFHQTRQSLKAEHMQ